MIQSPVANAYRKSALPFQTLQNTAGAKSGTAQSLNKTTHLQPQFGFIAQGLSSVVEWIDSSKAIELVTTDVMGMVLPRTYIEYRERGMDAGRETLIREIAGTVFNVFLVGWLGLGALHFFNKTNNKSSKMNPQGLHMGAWVNAKSLKAFQTLFTESLKPGQTPQQVRQAFVEGFIKSLKSTDPYVLGAATDAIKAVDSKLGEAVEAVFKQPIEGRLNPEGEATLKRLFELQTENRLGVANLQEQVAGFRKNILAEAEKAVSKLTTEAVDQLVTQKRLQASAASIGSVEETKLLESLYEAAHKGGLSHEVTLENGAKPLLGTRSLKSTLREFKHALEQYYDRALADVDGKISSTTALDEKAVQAIQERLEGKGLSWLERYIPFVGNKVEMGLIPYAMKSRWLLTVLPLVLTIGVSVSVSFINNWITRRRHGGKVFFPGEGGPQETAPKQGPAFGPTQPYNRPMLAYRSPYEAASPFEAFQRQRYQHQQVRGA
jgi:hypothetical protein